MNRRRFLLSGLPAAAAAASPRANHFLPASDYHYRRVQSYVENIPVPEYHWAPESSYERFRDIKYGVRLHWGLYSILGRPGESWPFLKMPFAERQRYQSLYQSWNPRGFDAHQWVDLFTECGMKMFAFTTKHHEGFSLFDTRTRVVRRADWTAPAGPRIEACDLAYSIMETPFRRDVVKELCDAAHQRGMLIDFYFSHPDWYDADFRPYAFHPLQVPSSNVLTTDYDEAKKRLGSELVIVPDPSPAAVNRMMARHRAQLTELLTRYGKIDMLCLDQWLGPQVWHQLRDTVLHLRSLQPDIMIRARGIGNYGDYYTPEGFVPGDKANTDTPWFVIYPLGSSFSYYRDETHYKGPAWVIRNLVDSAAKGGNFMVGIGPDGNGEFPLEAVRQLKEVGQWLRVNGDAIYATRARDGALWSEGPDVRFTRSKDSRTIYAFALQWPGETLRLASIPPRAGTGVRMLGANERLPWKPAGSGIEIQIPPGLQDESRRPCRHAWAFEIRSA